MKIAAWINARLHADQARHASATLVLAVALAHVPVPGAAPWELALLAGVLVSIYEGVQYATESGDPSWNDVAVNMTAAALVGLATIA